MDINNIFMNKIVFEARYEPNLLVYELSGRIQKKWRHQFPQINLDIGEQIILFNEDESRHIYASLENLGVVFHNDQIEEFCRVGEEFTSFIYSKAELNTLRRFGVRMEYVIPIEESDREKMKALKNMFGSRAPEHLGKKIVGLEWTINTLDENIHTRYHFDFVHKKSKAIETNKPEYALRIDTDMSKKGTVNLEESLVLLNQAHRLSKEKITGFLRTFLS